VTALGAIRNMAFTSKEIQKALFYRQGFVDWLVAIVGKVGIKWEELRECALSTVGCLAFCDEEGKNGLYEHPGLMACFVAVLMNREGRERGDEGQEVAEAIDIMACSGSGLARKLFEYPGLMVGLEKVKALVGNNYEEARLKANSAIDEITSYKQPEWCVRGACTDNDVNDIQNNDLSDKLTRMEKELSNNRKELVEARDSIFRMEKIIGKICNSLAIPDAVDLNDIDVTLTSPPPAFDSTGTKCSNLAVLAENNDNVKRIKKEKVETES